MNKPWFCLSDFDSNVGDIKGIWEASRFDWVLGLAKDYLSGREQALDELNATTKDWLKHNSPYLGAELEVWSRSVNKSHAFGYGC